MRDVATRAESETAWAGEGALSAHIARYLETGRIPGLGIGICSSEGALHSAAGGFADKGAAIAMSVETAFPIASTTKAINGLLLTMLVEDGLLRWDAPISDYVPGVGLDEARLIPTLRDLVMMRTGLPRHDWAWIGCPGSRAELAARLGHLPLSAPFRDIFQYSNLSITLTGQAAERVTGRDWFNLVRERIFAPLGMAETTAGPPADRPVTQCYHEDKEGRIRQTVELPSAITAPSGGLIYSTLTDMMKWMTFILRLARGKDELLGRDAAREYLSPLILVGNRSQTGIPRDAAYGYGWVFDHFSGRARISHAGYLHDVHSSIMIQPERDLAVCSFVNFGCSLLADTLSEDILGTDGSYSPDRLTAAVSLYEGKVRDNGRRIAEAQHPPIAMEKSTKAGFAGVYRHAGYGEFVVAFENGTVTLCRFDFTMPIYPISETIWRISDDWLAPVHVAHPFDRASDLVFEISDDGSVTALALKLEKSVPPLRFLRCS